MADRPLWRRTFDTVERAIAGPAEGAVRSDAFNDAVAVSVKARRRVERELERRSRQLLHLANVPTATDVRLLSEQVAGLQRELRRLRRDQEQRS